MPRRRVTAHYVSAVPSRPHVYGPVTARTAKGSVPLLVAGGVKFYHPEVSVAPAGLAFVPAHIGGGLADQQIAPVGGEAYPAQVIIGEAAKRPVPLFGAQGVELDHPKVYASAGGLALFTGNARGTVSRQQAPAIGCGANLRETVVGVASEGVVPLLDWPGSLRSPKEGKQQKREGHDITEHYWLKNGREAEGNGIPPKMGDTGVKNEINRQSTVWCIN